MASSPPSDDRAASAAGPPADGPAVDPNRFASGVAASVGPTSFAPATAGDAVGTVVLVGMMGTGKTSVGSKLALMLERPFLDSDREIERITGSTVAQIFAASGEGVFRDLETRVLREALDRADPVVVSAGGGVVLDDGNRRMLRAHDPVVWLRARVDTLVARVGNGHGRPLLDHDVAATMARLDAARRPLYEEVADLIVDVDSPGTPEGNLTGDVGDATGTGTIATTTNAASSTTGAIAGAPTDTAAPIHATDAAARETKIAEATATAVRIVAALTTARTLDLSGSGVTFACRGTQERHQNGGAGGGAVVSGGAEGGIRARRSPGDPS